MRRVLGYLAVGMLLLAVSACRNAPVYNVQSAALAAPSYATLADVSDAVRSAGADLGWQMIEEGPGRFTGRLALRSHVAVVDITFTTRTLSIVYRDSTNLNYDGTNIHSNYNGWIHNLQNAIQSKVSGIPRHGA